MEYKNNKIVAKSGYVLKSKSDIGCIDYDNKTYLMPYLCKKVYLAKNLSEEEAIDLYEEIDERDIDLYALTWEKELRAKIAENEEHRKAYEEALRKKDLESSSNSNIIEAEYEETEE